MAESFLHERVLAAVGQRTFRHVGELTGTHPETVRRYLGGQSPSAEFLSAVCLSMGINGEWLLTGRGPMRASEIQQRALRDAKAPDLLAAMAASVERLMDRMDRLEVFVQTMEVGLRAPRVAVAAGAPAGGAAHERSTTAVATAVADPADRARRVADALPQRPSADAR